MNLETRVARLEDEASIRRLKWRFCSYTDQTRVEEWLSLLTEDATISAGLPHQDADHGHEELRKRIEGIRDENRRFMSHFAHNPVIEVDGDEARGHWYFSCLIVFADETVTWLLGEYDDEYRRVDGRWKIHSVAITIRYRQEFEDGTWSLETK